MSCVCCYNVSYSRWGGLMRWNIISKFQPLFPKYTINTLSLIFHPCFSSFTPLPDFTEYFIFHIFSILLSLQMCVYMHEWVSIAEQKQAGFYQHRASLPWVLAGTPSWPARETAGTWNCLTKNEESNSQSLWPHVSYNNFPSEHIRHNYHY